MSLARLSACHLRVSTLNLKSSFSSVRRPRNPEARKVEKRTMNLTTQYTANTTSL